MSGSDDRKKLTRIAIAIELDEPYPHHHEVYRGILDYADQREDWLCVVDPYNVGMTGDEECGEYDGVVGRIGKHAASVAERNGIPMVNCWLNSPVSDLPSVYSDFAEGGRMVAEHLVARGFRRFGYLGTGRDRVGPIELKGFERYLKEGGYAAPVKLRVPRDFEKSPQQFARARKALYEWVRQLTPSIGLFVPGDVMARYLVQICRELDLRVPLEVGVVAQYNIDMIGTATEPSISSIDHDNYMLGYRSAELLDTLITKRCKPPEEPILIKPRGLIVRASSDAFVVKDEMVSAAMRYISSHAREAITVQDVASHLSTTTRTLARAFERSLGRSVYSEISRMRVEHIKRRLLDSDAPLGEIARECGFGSPSHFALYFRKMTGMQPREYRRRDSE